jgi:hypothetical protein
MLAESVAITGFTQALPDPMFSFEQYAPRTRPLSPSTLSSRSPPLLSSPTLYVDIMRHATEIYLLRAKSHTQPPNPQDMSRRIAHLRREFEAMDPGAAGAHTIVWPAFVAAAEAQEETDRQFFAGVLQRIWLGTGYGNVRRGLDALPAIWALQGRERWTAALDRLGTVIM